MSDPEIILHLALAGLAAFYAFILERNHDKYAPDYIWVTVVIGNGLIIAAAYVAANLGIIALPAFRTFLTLNVAAGAPIIIWQLDQKRRRAKERTAARHRKETGR